jgi:aldehyde dehydrogenase (NAD+)
MHLEPAQNFINGNWTPALAGETMPVYEPATGQAYAAIAASTAQDVDLAVRAARKAFDEGPWGKTTAVDRGPHAFTPRRAHHSTGGGAGCH